MRNSKSACWFSLPLSFLIAFEAFAADFDTTLLASKESPENALWLHKLDLSKMTAGFGTPQPDRSIKGKPITLKGTVYPHGIGTHAASEMSIDLKGVATRFVAMVGVDDETNGKGSVVFEVWVDDRQVFNSGVMRGNNAPKLVDLSLVGVHRLELWVTEATDGITMDYADWAGAMIMLQPGAVEKPQAIFGYPDPAMPIASTIPPAEPQIHGPRITGATPGKPFLFLVPATGQGPLEYSADNLPHGLSIDSKTGIISGVIAQEGVVQTDLRIRGPKGDASRGLTIVAGRDKLALTPPMGWNSWFIWAGHIDDAKMRQTSDLMLSTGLAAHGYQFVTIDDCWQAKRDENGEIQGNERFPDMKSLGDYIHSKGLKFGIYTSPGPGTCAGYPGSYQHEEQDVQTYAKWGVDFLKLDWCSYGYVVKGDSSLDAMKKPFALFGAVLQNAGRDIVYSLCQYGNGDVWKWGPEVRGNMWRSTGDSGDNWGVMSQIGFSQDGLEPYAGPGHWNDPDMLQVGLLGMSSKPRPTNLAPNEQITQVSLWSILAAPFIISCDLAQMDPFTKDLLMNDEILDVNQDVLGKQGYRRAKDGNTEVWARELADGTIAVGLFNRGRKDAMVTAHWNDLNIKGSQPIRDLWLHKNLGTFRDEFSIEVPRHGAKIVKIGKASR